MDFTTVTYDDGSTMTWDPDYTTVTSTPANADAYVQGATGGAASGFFDILNGFTGLVTKTGQSIVTLQAQVDAIASNQAARDIAKAKQDAALTTAKTSAQIQEVLAQRQLELAKLGTQPLSMTTLLLFGLGAWAVMRK